MFVLEMKFYVLIKYMTKKNYQSFQSYWNIDAVCIYIFEKRTYDIVVDEPDFYFYTTICNTKWILYKQEPICISLVSLATVDSSTLKMVKLFKRYLYNCCRCIFMKEKNILNVLIIYLCFYLPLNLIVQGILFFLIWFLVRFSI